MVYKVFYYGKYILFFAIFFQNIYIIQNIEFIDGKWQLKQGKIMLVHGLF
jgi:hypothetical protein